MLENLRVHLHCYWQVIKRDLKAWTTSCQQCGALGAYPCSIAACIPLCNGCATEESVKLDKKLDAEKWSYKWKVSELAEEEKWRRF